MPNTPIKRAAANCAWLCLGDAVPNLIAQVSVWQARFIEASIASSVARTITLKQSVARILFAGESGDSRHAHRPPCRDDTSG